MLAARLSFIAAFRGLRALVAGAMLVIAALFLLAGGGAAFAANHNHAISHVSATHTAQPHGAVYVNPVESPVLDIGGCTGSHHPKTGSKSCCSSSMCCAIEAALPPEGSVVAHDYRPVNWPNHERFVFSKSGFGLDRPPDARG